MNEKNFFDDLVPSIPGIIMMTAELGEEAQNLKFEALVLNHKIYKYLIKEINLSKVCTYLHLYYASGRSVKSDLLPSFRETLLKHIKLGTNEGKVLFGYYNTEKGRMSWY